MSKQTQKMLNFILTGNKSIQKLIIFSWKCKEIIMCVPFPIEIYLKIMCTLKKNLVF